MKVIKKNIWDFLEKEIIIIPTNGFVKSNGCAVMGRGLAKQCLNRFKSIDVVLGNKLSYYGNVPHIIHVKKRIISFPVKPEGISIKKPDDIKKVLSRFNSQDSHEGKFYPGWMCKADLNLIEKSCILLNKMYYENRWEDWIVMPKVGCGNGELNWNQVEPIIKKHLNNIVLIVDNK